MLTSMMLCMSFGIADDDLTKELAKFKGEWRVEKAIANGEEAPAKEIEKARFTFDGKTISVNERDEKADRGTFELDLTKSPKTIDLKHDTQSIKGIYKWDGKSLIIAFRKSGERPTDFESKANSEVVVIHLAPAK